MTPQMLILFAALGWADPEELKSPIAGIDSEQCQQLEPAFRPTKALGRFFCRLRADHRRPIVVYLSHGRSSRVLPTEKHPTDFPKSNRAGFALLPPEFQQTPQGPRSFAATEAPTPDPAILIPVPSSAGERSLNCERIDTSVRETSAEMIMEQTPDSPWPTLDDSEAP